MFGYVLINKPELRIREFDLYHSYYCGLCHALNERFGMFGRLTLNFDMVFLLMLLADLYDREGEPEFKRCVMHPVTKHCYRKNEITDYCADMCLLLSYYKCLDDWNDEKKVVKGAWAKTLKSKVNRLEKEYSGKAEVIKAKLVELDELEKSGDFSEIDQPAKIFGEIMAEAFCYKEDNWKNDLYNLGFYLGKFIYILDAYEDYEKDIKNNSYNPFKGFPNDEDMEKYVMDSLLLMMGEATSSFERLPLIENVEVLRNILYSGVWGKFNKHKKEGEAHESI